jgi:hypothetical protein
VRRLNLFGTGTSARAGPCLDAVVLGRPRPPSPPADAGWPVTFSRAGVTAVYDPDRWASLLELAEACDVGVRWSCRTGVCRSCESALVDGAVAYSPKPLEEPGGGLILPLLVGVILLPVRLTRAERRFVLWSGLKGAVPIVLGILLLLQGVPQAQQLYATIFVVVLISVVVQDSTVPLVAQRLRIPMKPPGSGDQAVRRAPADHRRPVPPAPVSETHSRNAPG